MRVTAPPAGRRLAPRRWLTAALLALLGVVALVPPTAASAHAVLTASDPADGEALDAPPDEVRLTFNEPVRANEGALRAFDAEGERIDTGSIETGDGAVVAVGLPDDLEASAYVVSYRVVSADSHPITGTVTFTVGDAPALDAETVAAIAGPGAGPLGTVGSVLRGLGYVGTLLAAGAVIFAAAVARGRADRDRAARIGRPAAVVGAAAVLLHVPVQAAAVSGFGLWAATTDPAVLGDTLTSGFGQSSIARLAALLALATPWFTTPRPTADRPSDASATSREVATPAEAATSGEARDGGARSPLWWLGVAAALALASYLVDGHQRTVEPTWLLIAGDAVHVAAAAAWFGGVVLLLTTLRRTRAEDDPVAAATVVARFSRLAIWSVLALTVAGTAMALPLVRSVDALTSTGYGWTLVAKVALAAVLVAIAAYNRYRLVPAITAHATPAGGSVDATPADLEATTGARGEAWTVLARTVGTEVVLLVAVLGLTGFLVSTQPAAEAAGLTGPTSISAPLTDDLTLDVTVTPSAAGVNSVHVFTLEPNGQPSDAVEDLRLEFTYVDEDIGPFRVEPYTAGPGHWTATIEDLRFAGEWELRVVGAIDRFEEVDVTVPFTVR